MAMEDAWYKTRAFEVFATLAYLLLKAKSSPTIHLWRRRGERMYNSYSFTTSALDGVSGKRHVPAGL
jgi:hypothetical protein